MNHPEEDLQKAVVQLLGIALPASAMFWTTPNQRGTRKRWENQLLKAMGVLAGFPDLAILWRSRLYLIELKAPGGALSPAQKALHVRLGLAGAKVWVCFSIEQVIERLELWEIPLRAKL